MPFSRRKFLAGAAALAAQLFLGLRPGDNSRVWADPGLKRNFFDLSPLERRAIEADMVAIPSPPVTPIGTNHQILYPFNYKRLLSEEAVTLYDAPDGNVVRTIPSGFNFVSIVREEGDWVEINYGEWVRGEFIGPPRISEFTGVILDQPLLYPLGWLLMDSKPSSRPGINPPSSTPDLPRYMPVNVFGRQRVGEWDWFLIGPGQWVNQRRVGMALPIEPPEGVSGRWVGVDLYEQVLIAYQDRQPVFATLISSGLPDWATDEGLYQIIPEYRFTATPMIGALGAPDSYVIEDIPWTMYYNMHSEESLHGTFWHDGFGYRHSHGCVNMTITDARWLFEWTLDGYEDAWVYIYHSQEYNQ